MGYHRDTTNVSLSNRERRLDVGVGGVFSTGMALGCVERKALFFAVKYLAIQVGDGG